MISGKDNFTRAIEFRGPQRLPCLLGVNLDWLHEQDPTKQERVRQLRSEVPDDLVGGLDCWPFRYRPAGAIRWTDQFGTRWTNEGTGAYTIGHAAEEGYHKLEGFRWPDPHQSDRFDGADVKLAARGDRYARADVWFTLFTRMWHLRGFTNMLTDPYLHPDDWLRLRDRIVEIDLALIDQWIERKVDGIFMEDDWGTQEALLMDPDDWRRLYKPAYARLFERARAGGAHVWYHSCGNVRAIVPDLIGIGVSVLNPVQPQAMDLAELSREFGGKLCFYGGIDSQGTLINATARQVKDEVRTIVDLFGRFDGGYIGAPSQTIMPETPLDNIIAAMEALAEFR